MSDDDEDNTDTSLTASQASLQAREPLMKQARLQDKYIYGNYRGYYGYRHGECEQQSRITLEKPWPIDHRLVSLSAINDNKDFLSCSLHNKKVLDIGCNEGMVTIDLAQNFGARFVLGIDIDRELVGKARQNVERRYSLTKPPGALQVEPDSVVNDNAFFPKSLPIVYGTIPAASEIHNKHLFPHNIRFGCQNWIDDPPKTPILPEYDVIFCLSVTKWIQLNWGDAGIDRLFRKCWQALKEGGLFILEPQAFATYARRKNLTKEITQQYSNIVLKPEEFPSYLTNKIGFDLLHSLLSAEESAGGGFDRPMYVFRKLEDIK